MQEIIDYFKGDELAASVWKGKYAMKGEKTPEDMHKRMAKEFARIELKYGKTLDKKLLEKLSNFGQYFENNFWNGNPEETIQNYFNNFGQIVPQGSIMSMLGNKYKIGSLSNCFVVGQPHDSYGGIMQKDQELVQLMKRRGGVGIDISTLRPSNTLVSNAAGSSTGAVSFMHRYSNSCREVAQNGRRGALMITIDCRHPDVLEFINVKKDLTQVTGANISVQLRDDFMQAVKEDKDYLLRFPCNLEVEDNFSDLEYNKLETWANCVVKKVKAREYFNNIVTCNWLSAEPGLMFVNKHWDYSPDGVYSQYRGITTNPCGEIFMAMYDACRLLALNFYNIVTNHFTNKAKIDYDKLYEIAYIQQRLADDIVDLELEYIDNILKKIDKDNEPEEIKRTEKLLWENIRKVAASSRRTGAGFTALGDMLAALSLKYDSEKAKETIEKVCKKKLEAELDCTIDLAILRGTFEGWDKNKEGLYIPEGDFVGANDFYNMLYKEFSPQWERMCEYGRRNVSWNTVAPTGTVDKFAA